MEFICHLIIFFPRCCHINSLNYYSSNIVICVCDIWFKLHDCSNLNRFEESNSVHVNQSGRVWLREIPDSKESHLNCFVHQIAAEHLSMGVLELSMDDEVVFHLEVGDSGESLIFSPQLWKMVKMLSFFSCGRRFVHGVWMWFDPLFEFFPKVSSGLRHVLIPFLWYVYFGQLECTFRPSCSHDEYSISYMLKVFIIFLVDITFHMNSRIANIPNISVDFRIYISSQIHVHQIEMINRRCHNTTLIKIRFSLHIPQRRLSTKCIDLFKHHSDLNILAIKFLELLPELKISWERVDDLLPTSRWRVIGHLSSTSEVHLYSIILEVIHQLGL